MWLKKIFDEAKWNLYDKIWNIFVWNKFELEKDKLIINGKITLTKNEDTILNKKSKEIITFWKWKILQLMFWENWPIKTLEQLNSLSERKWFHNLLNYIHFQLNSYRNLSLVSWNSNLTSIANMGNVDIDKNLQIFNKLFWPNWTLWNFDDLKKFVKNSKLSEYFFSKLFEDDSNVNELPLNQIIKEAGDLIKNNKSENRNHYKFSRGFSKYVLRKPPSLDELRELLKEVFKNKKNRN